MSRAWMPMYWGDYLADTPHFSTAQHGAYLLLIAYYWCNGGLPTDEEQIRKIAKCSPLAWCKIRSIVMAKFDGMCRHKRIDIELSKAIEKSKVNSANAKRKHRPVADVSHTHSQSHSQEKAKKLSLLPEDWQPNGSGWKTTEAYGWSFDKTNQEIERFKDHAKANNRRQADWDAAWRNWVTSPYQHKGNGHHERKRTLVEIGEKLAADAEALERAASFGSADDAFGSDQGSDADRQMLSERRA